MAPPIDKFHQLSVLIYLSLLENQMVTLIVIAFQKLVPPVISFIALLRSNSNAFI